MLILGPIIRLYAVILKVLELRHSKLAALGYYLCTGIVLDAHRRLTLSKRKKLVYENVLQVVYLGCIFLVYLGKHNLVLLL